jgi:predicted transcriptional regulator
MSAITINLPDALVERLKDCDDLDQFVTYALWDKIESEDQEELPDEAFDNELNVLTDEELAELKRRLEEIDRGETCSLDELRVFLKENREQTTVRLAERQVA